MSISKKIISYIFITLAFILIISLAKDSWRLLHADKRISQAEEKLVKLRQENTELKDKLNYYQGEEFIEEEIRNKLQLVKPGESIIILPEGLSYSASEESEIRKNDQAPELKNWQKWLSLFL